jgi:hypothetical protein
MPQRFLEIDQVNIHGRSLPEAWFGVDARKTVLESWLTLRRVTSASAELRDVKGDLQHTGLPIAPTT